MANYKNYTNKEMQAITIAKTIKDGQIVIVGTGLPLIAVCRETEARSLLLPTAVSSNLTIKPSGCT